MSQARILINRAPVLTLWAAIVAERLGFDPEEALSLGKAVGGLTAQSKGRRLGIFAPTAETLKKARKQKRAKEFWIEILGRNVGTASSFELPRRRPGQGDRWPGCKILHRHTDTPTPPTPPTPTLMNTGCRLKKAGQLAVFIEQSHLLRCDKQGRVVLPGGTKR